CAKRTESTGLVATSLQEDAGRGDRQDPHRPHGDDKRADRVAGRKRGPIEGFENQHVPVEEDHEPDADGRESLPVHRQGNGRPRAGIVMVMAALFGFHMPNYTFPGVPNDRLFAHVIDQAKAAEAAGFDLVTVMDHLYQIRGIGPETEPMLEAYTTLAAIATQTSRVKLGTLVTGVTYRNPALLVKEVTTLDVISKGRAVLGIGAAWNED